MKIKLPVMAACLMLFSLCSKEPKKSQLEVVVDSFATHYFNCQYKESLPFVTKGSQKWLYYAASQINQEDIETLQEQTESATHEVESITLKGKKTSAHICIRVNNFLQLDSAGISDHATFTLKAVKEDGKWKIKMEGLPQNERRNRD